MAHELSFDANGDAEAFFVKQSAWHREGHLWQESPSFEQAMSVVGYEVGKRDSYTRLLTADGDEYFRKNETSATIWRLDSEVELGTVGPDYQIIQGSTAFRGLEPLVDSGILLLDTGGILRKGADAWLLGRFDTERFGPTLREVYGRENMVPYFLVTVNHTGRKKATMAETTIRVVCANTLGMAERGMNASNSVGVSHKGNAEVKMIDASEKMLAGIIARFETVAEQYRLLRQTILDRQAFEKLVLDAVCPDPKAEKEFKADSPRAELVVERAEAKRGELTRMWTSGAGHTADFSAFEAYNAVAEVLDHDAAGLFPTRGQDGGRVQSLLDGRLGELKAIVLTNLTKHAVKAGK